MISVIALFIALGAGAYAAGLPKNSVGTKQLKKNAVKTSKIANGAVKAPKIANGAVKTPKIASRAVGSAQLTDGAVGSGQLANRSVSAEKLVSGLLAPSCPEGMGLFGRTVCIDVAVRGAAAWGDAMSACAEAGLRLPSEGEIWLARSLVVESQAWTEVGFREGGVEPDASVAIAIQSLVGGGHRLRVHAVGAELPFFCAAPPGVG